MLKIKTIICTLIFTTIIFTAGPIHAGWTIQNPLPTGKDLYAMWGSSGSNVFAAGSEGVITQITKIIGCCYSTMFKRIKRSGLNQEKKRRKITNGT